MDRLPTDILRDILDYLDPEYTDVSSRMKFWKPPRIERGSQDVLADIRRFRLVCRRFGDIGAQYLFRIIAHRYDSKSFDRLSKLADHPVFAGHVKKFVYLMPYFYVQGAKDFTEFKKDFDEFHMQIGSYSTIFQEPLHCLEVFEEQQHLMNSGNDLKILKKAMKSFTSLQQVQILSVLGEKDNKLLDLAENYDEWDYVDCRWIPACQHAVETMIQALDYGRPPVYSFVSPRMSPQSLLRLSPEVQELGMSTWSQLTYLKLNFSHMSDRDTNQTQLESKIVLLSEFFKTLFSTAKNLMELHIGFFPSSPLELQLEEVFHDTIWPKLRILGIEAWRLTSAEIIAIIQRHSTTLRGLRLANIVLREGSLWRDIVVEIRTLDLEWLSLDDIDYELEFDRKSRERPTYIFPDTSDESENGAGSDYSSVGFGFNISLDGSTSSHAGESSNISTSSHHSSSQQSHINRSSDVYSPTTSHSQNGGEHDNFAGSSSGGTRENPDPVHLIPTGVIERPGMNGKGVMLANGTNRFDEQLSDMSINLEDDGNIVTELQMVHWERWAVGRDVYTGRKYSRDL